MIMELRVLFCRWPLEPCEQTVIFMNVVVIRFTQADFPLRVLSVLACDQLC